MGKVERANRMEVAAMKIMQGESKHILVITLDECKNCGDPTCGGNMAVMGNVPKKDVPAALRRALSAAERSGEEQQVRDMISSLFGNLSNRTGG